MKVSVLLERLDEIRSNLRARTTKTDTVVYASPEGLALEALLSELKEVKQTHKIEVEVDEHGEIILPSGFKVLTSPTTNETSEGLPQETQKNDGKMRVVPLERDLKLAPKPRHEINGEDVTEAQVDSSATKEWQEGDI